MSTTILAKISNLLNNNVISAALSNRSKVGDLVLDATLSEVIDLSSTVTQNPVESGSSVSDHIYLNPIRVKMTGFIADFTFDIFSAPTFNINAVLENTSAIRSRSLKQSTAYEILKDQWLNKSVLTIVNYLDVFDNMVIENLQFPVDQKTEDRLYFEIDLIQITAADVETVNISNNPQPTQDLISAKANLGTRQTRPPSAEETAKIKSGFANAIDFLRE